MRRALSRLGHFFNVQLWEDELKSQRGLRGLFYRQLRRSVIVVQTVPRGQIPLRAAAMTVATLLALVPGIVLAFTLLGAFGGVEPLELQLRRFILQNLVSGTQEQISNFLERYFEGARAFQGITLAFLLGGVFGLIASIEDAFNQIWGVKRGRSLSNRLTTYTTIAVLGPFLLAVSLTMTASVQNPEFLNHFKMWAPEWLVTVTFRLVPLIITIVGLTMLYMIMPNIKVRLVPALIGAVVAGIAWEISKWGYSLYISSATMYRTLYGQLVAIPLLFLWIQLSWIIVLFGALLTFAQDASDDFRLEENAMTASYRERLKAGLRCMIVISRAHYAGWRAPNVSDLATHLRIPVRLVRSVIADLLAGELLHEILQPRDRGEGGLVPSRDLQNLSVHDVIACLRGAGTSAPLPRDTAEAREAERILALIDDELVHIGVPMAFSRIVEALGKEREGTGGTPEPVELFKRR